MVAVLLAEGFEEIETIVPVDILRRANVTVHMFSIGSRLVQGGHGISIECDDFVSNLTDNIEGIIIPGGHEGASNIANSTTCGTLITKVNRARKMIAAICAAPALVLEPLNILAGKRFTCHPSYRSTTSSGKYQNNPVVVDGNIITAQAAGSSLLFAQQIIAYIQSKEVGNKIMNDIYFNTLQ